MQTARLVGDNAHIILPDGLRLAHSRSSSSTVCLSVCFPSGASSLSSSFLHSPVAMTNLIMHTFVAFWPDYYARRDCCCCTDGLLDSAPTGELLLLLLLLLNTTMPIDSLF